MIRKSEYGKYLIWFILLYGLLITVLNLNYNSIYMDEAIPILIGRQLLEGAACTGCPYMTGSVLIQPVFMAIGDYLGGLYGARIMNTLIGLGLTIIIYLTARLMFNKKLGIIAAFLFICSGQTLYLMKLATYDMIAAFFLGFAFLMIVVSEKAETEDLRRIALFEGAFILFIAAITKYLIPCFIPFLLLYVLIKHGVRRTFVFYLLPLTALLVLFYFFAPFAPKAEVLGQVKNARNITNLPLATLADWAFRWVSLAYLLAIFGVFHERESKATMALIVLSTPIIIVHLATQTEQSVNKNMIYALVFLAPAGAIGVDHICNLFSMKSDNRTVRAFFTIAVLMIFWAYGLNNLRWLEKQYPDVSPIIEFFDENGYDGMTVAMNGWDGIAFTYTFAAKFPEARFPHISQVTGTDNPGHSFREKVDFVVCEEFYGKDYPCEEIQHYIEDDYALLEYFTITHSWGMTDAKIYGRK